MRVMNDTDKQIESVVIDASAHDRAEKHQQDQEHEQGIQEAPDESEKRALVFKLKL